MMFGFKSGMTCQPWMRFESYDGRENLIKLNFFKNSVYIFYLLHFSTSVENVHFIFNLSMSIYVSENNFPKIEIMRKQIMTDCSCFAELFHY